MFFIRLCKQSSRWEDVLDTHFFLPYRCISFVQFFFYILILIYRVSIKSFPDYKHLLQENYVEYKHIFFKCTNVL